MSPKALDDPEIAATAWARFRGLMRWMALSGALCVLAVLGFLYWIGTPMPIHMIIATTAGVWCTFMLGTALMSLAFLSSGTGHDEQIDDRLKKEAGYDET
ncbi:hypothetical protein [Sphingobium subterraneum]|uniref:Uncharacterized protein n=1 Tax=Sphingobium subterraneum TaxID=627688 RepID=A0A841IZU0_9SPHN|nr:hypothetical protein [Sphingobium subterraneum]MBB6123934.1 hypothetical protein [Sphingobium subterraneum]